MSKAIEKAKARLKVIDRLIDNCAARRSRAFDKMWSPDPKVICSKCGHQKRFAPRIEVEPFASKYEAESEIYAALCDVRWDCDRRISALTAMEESRLPTLAEIKRASK